MSSVQIRQGRLFRFEMRTRMPFRYGIATVTELPHLFVRLAVRVDGAEHVGLAADHLAPKWFTKNPDTPPGEDIAGMLRVVRQAVAFAEGAEAETPFALWRTLYDRQAEWGAREGLAPLLTHFGVTLIERAMLDAFCRAKALPFARLLRENAFGVRLAGLRPGQPEFAPDALPDAPLPSVLARHTVGLADVLTEAELDHAERLADGLPQSLEACVREYGLRHFKIKVGGGARGDAERLARITSTLATTVPGDDWAFSLDGNESYRTVPDFRAFWDAARDDAALAAHLDRRLLFVEQPFHRDIALSPEVGAAFADWQDRPRFVIDESDGALSDLPLALSLGYAGTSHKNCKGVFKGVANAVLLRSRGGLLSGEDLSNVGPVSLQQDLAVQAALGIESVERNGHHYFTGLSMFPPDVQQAAQAAHPDLFRAAPPGYPTLAVTGGRLALGTVNAAPFGYAVPPETLDVTRFDEA